MAPTPQRDAMSRLSAIDLDVFELAELELATWSTIQERLDASGVAQNNGAATTPATTEPPATPPTTPPVAEPPATPPAAAGEEGLPDTVKEILKKNREAAAAAEKTAREAQAELKKLQDRDKSELERAQEAKATAEKAAADASSELLRLKVATAKGIPLDLAARLQGATEDELAADADRLLPLLKPAGSETETGNSNGDKAKIKGSFDGGPRGADGAKRYTREQIEAMSPAEINANWTDVQASLKST